MQIIKNIWGIALQKLFLPSERKWLVLYSIPFNFCLCLIVLDSVYSVSLHRESFVFLLLAINLLSACTSLLINKIILFGFIGFLDVYFLGLRGIQTICELGWLISMHLTIFIAYGIMLERKKKNFAEEKEVHKLEKAAQLWEKRCHILGEQKQGQLKVSEEVIETMKKTVETKQTRIDSLKELMKLIRQESCKGETKLLEMSKKNEELAGEIKLQREDTTSFELEGKLFTQEDIKRILDSLNYYRVEYHQQKLLLQRARRREDNQKEIFQKKQQHREKLLDAKLEKPISLEVIAKGIK